MPYKIVTFYKFNKLTNTKDLKQPLMQLCIEQGIKGTLILATEGINGTLAGNNRAIDFFIDQLSTYPGFTDIDYKFSYSHTLPFKKIKIHIKKEIVTMGISTPVLEKTGTPISPIEWNALISQPDVLLIDTRNDFEVALGSFKGAVDPNTQKFSDFPEYVRTQLDPNIHKKIAMCCTGGVRCEKASAYLLDQGFEQVYQLQGGILKYIDQIDAKESLWEGQCFIFDERVVYTQFPNSFSDLNSEASPAVTTKRTK